MNDVTFVVVCHWHGNRVVQHPGFKSYEEAVELGKAKLDEHPRYGYFTIEKHYTRGED